ncbi:hypothetical protein T05_257 [Trichinella murrelli]|uniref:FLYWCH-type domain-containing protein n=1 Tax=Trichinella murrelli TaxID=144512 RepID=A0A0V0T649_9BILA|nr:hypothetical protein T05_257 [Trichinella murrelli]
MKDIGIEYLKISLETFRIATYCFPELSELLSVLFSISTIADIPVLCLVPNRGGSMALLFEGRAYKLKRTGKQKKCWRCSKDKIGCKGAVWTDLEVTAGINRKDHVETCQVDEHLAYKMEKKALLKKRSADETKPIPAIYDEEASAASAEPSTSGHFPLFKRVRSTMYKHRAKRFPRLPEHRHDLVIPDQFKTTKSGEDFLLCQSNSRHILVFATGTNIRLLAACRTWGMDVLFVRVIQIIFFLFLMADVPELHLLQNRCGDTSLVYEGKAYKLKRAGRQKYWRCSKDKEGCGGAIWTNLDVTSVINRNDHMESCPVDEHLAYKMEKRAVLTKRSAEETKPIPAIYDEEASAASAEPSTSGYFPLFRRVRAAMYGHRAKRFPKLPNHRRDLQIPDAFRTTMAGEDFLLWQSASRHILVLATGSNIRLMATRRTWALDGTFKIVPQWYQQLFTKHAFLAGKLVLAVYCLCTDKDIPTYGFILSKSGITGNPHPQS